jgi:hypothetical protein
VVERIRMNKMTCGCCDICVFVTNFLLPVNNQMKHHQSLLKLSHDELYEIVSFLDIQSNMNCGATCSTMRTVCGDERFWSQFISTQMTKSIIEKRFYNNTYQLILSHQIKHCKTKSEFCDTLNKTDKFIHEYGKLFYMKPFRVKYLVFSTIFYLVVFVPLLLSFALVLFALYLDTVITQSVFVWSCFGIGMIVNGGWILLYIHTVLIMRWIPILSYMLRPIYHYILNMMQYITLSSSRNYFEFKVEPYLLSSFGFHLCDRNVEKRTIPTICAIVLGFANWVIVLIFMIILKGVISLSSHSWLKFMIPVWIVMIIDLYLNIGRTWSGFDSQHAITTKIMLSFFGTIVSHLVHYSYIVSIACIAAKLDGHLSLAPWSVTLIPLYISITSAFISLQLGFPFYTIRSITGRPSCIFYFIILMTFLVLSFIFGLNVLTLILFILKLDGSLSTSKYIRLIIPSILYFATSSIVGIIVIVLLIFYTKNQRSLNGNDSSLNYDDEEQIL